MKEQIKNTEIKQASQLKLTIEFFKTPIIIILLVLLCPVLMIQTRYLKSIRKSPPYRDSVYLPSGKVVKPLALGFDMALADLLWLRSIQAFGGHFFGDKAFKSIFNLFDVITDLDPYFIEAYTFGNLVMGDESGDQESALRLLDKGIQKMPKEYRLPYEALYVCNWQLKDKNRAKRYAVLALKTDNCPDFVKRILYTLEIETGRYTIAYEKFLSQYLESYTAQKDLVFNINKSKIIEVVDEWQLSIMLKAAKEFKEKNNRDIESLEELEQSGLLPEYTVPDVKIAFALADEYYSQGKKLPNMMNDILTKSMITSNRIPKAPYEDSDKYIVVSELSSDSEKFIMSVHAMKELVKDTFLTQFRYKINEYYQNNNKYPPTMDDIYGEPIKLREPFGGKWLYNPETGEIKSSTYPQL